MCGLCGAFGIVSHWSDGITGPGGLAARRHRTQVANEVLQLFGLTYHDWSNRYTLRTRTGKIAMVEHLGAVWPKAELLSGQLCDPLDPLLIETIEARAAGAGA